MSLARVQLKRFLSDAAKFLLRRGRTIPTKGQILTRARERMKDTTLGGPIFRAQKQIQSRQSNAEDYNENIQAAKFDIDTFSTAAMDQSLRLLRNFSATYVELRRISNQITGLVHDIDATKFYQDGYNYVIGDAFASLDLIDGERSTVMPDLSTGKISLQTGIAKTANLNFLASTTSPSGLHFSKPILKHTLAPGSFFGNIFDGSSSYWKVHALLHESGPLSMSLEIPLSKDGSSREVNGAYVDSLTLGICTLEYRDKGIWRTVVADKLAHTNAFSFSTISTEVMRVTVKRPTHDELLGDRYLYEFGFRSIVFYLSTNKLVGEFYSMSLPLAPGLSKDATAVAVDLVVEEVVAPGTSIEYFVAVDPYVSGSLYPEGYYTVDGVDPYLHGSEGLVWSHDASGGYVLSSTLRDFSTLSGLTDWSSWTPNWHALTPTTEGRPEPVYLDFANFIAPEETLNGFPERAKSFGKWGNIRFLKIFEFKDTYNLTRHPIPSNIMLHPGKDCFLFREQHLKYKDDIVGQGIIVDGRMVIYGTEQARVVHSSVRNLRSWGADPSEEGSFFTEPDDYIVNYGVPDRWSAEVVQNAGRINILGEDFLPVQYTYSYRRLEPYYTLETSFYYDRNVSQRSKLSDVIEPIIKIYWWVHEGFGRMSEVTLINYDENGVVRGRHSETQRAAEELVKIDIRTVGVGTGWYTLKITLDLRKELKMICKTIEGGPDVGMHVLEIDTGADISREGITLSFIQSIFMSLQPMKRIVLPDYLTIFAWREPATQVSEDYLKYCVHKFDHSKFAVIQQTDGYYAVLSNNVGQFAGNTRLIHQGEAVDTIDGIMEMDTSEFYDIAYMTCAGKFDSLLFKSILRGTGGASPELKSYTLRVTG